MPHMLVPNIANITIEFHFFGSKLHNFHCDCFSILIAIFEIWKNLKTRCEIYTHGLYRAPIHMLGSRATHAPT